MTIKLNKRIVNQIDSKKKNIKNKVIIEDVVVLDVDSFHSLYGLFCYLVYSFFILMSTLNSNDIVEMYEKKK